METRMRVHDLRVGILAYIVGQSHIYARLCDTRNGRTTTFRLASCLDAIPRIDGLAPALANSCPEGHAEFLFRSFAEEWGCILLPPAKALATFDVLQIIPRS